MLYVNVINLMRDSTENWFSRNDLFVVITYKDQRRRTNTVWNIHEPCWNEHFLFEYEGPGSITFEIYDDNNWRKEELMSKFTLPVGYGEICEIIKENLSIKMGYYHYEMNNKISNLQETNDDHIKTIRSLNDQNKLHLNYKKTIQKIKSLLHEQSL